jgi:hypothetical protein
VTDYDDSPEEGVAHLEEIIFPSISGQHSEPAASVAAKTTQKLENNGTRWERGAVHRRRCS